MLLCGSLLVGAACVFAQKTPPVAAPSAWTPAQIATLARLRDRAMQDDYALTRLRHLTDNIGPRLSGSAQAAQAVEYVAAEMRALGAEVTLEKTVVPHWVRGLETAELTGWPGQPPGTTQKIVLTALGGSVATPADGLTAQVLVVNSFDELKSLSPGATKGRILLFNERFDKRLAAQGNGDSAYGQAVVYRGLGPSIGAAAGAIAVLVRSVGGADFRLPHTGALSYTPDAPQVPAAAVTAEDADLLGDLTQQGPVQMHLTLTPKDLPPVESANVVADWKGSEHPEQVVIVSGHLDSWDLGTGAIDDGAGIVVSMEVIRLLRELDLHPKRTIRFVAWMDEEHGGEGATTYAQDHATELANHIGALESDLGAGHPGGVAYVGTPQLEAWLRPAAAALEPIGAAGLIHVPFAGEDIDPLTSKGVPSFSPAQDSRFYFNYHHTAADTFDKVNPIELNENAAVMAVVAYALADAAVPAPR
jgi:carboxypeptidase Q